MSNLSNIENDWETFFQKGEDMMMTYDAKNETPQKLELFENNIETTVNEKTKSMSSSVLENGSTCVTDFNLPSYTDINQSSVKCGPLYISTKTVIGYINVTKMIDLMELFWKVPILDYHIHQEGILKKQIKLAVMKNEDIESYRDKVASIPNAKVILLSKPSSNPNNQKQTYKINVGLSKKDMTSYRKKEKNVFYNCFALIIRMKDSNGVFKEIHLKLFNTGKMEIPGIQNDEMLFNSIWIMAKLIHPFLLEQGCVSQNISEIFHKTSIDTVFINSNFNCGYFIKRSKMFDILRDEYNIICLYDPCSYPGIQAKFYYNENQVKKKNNDDYKITGQCKCETRCGKKNGQCKEISFMIFRTGSVLILGHCEFEVIEIIYLFLKKMFEDHYFVLNDGIVTDTKHKKVNRVIKKKIIINK